MTSSKHTPGPWKITYQGYRHNGDYSHQIGTEDLTVAYTWCPCDHSPPPRAMEANAHLIAAAPDMKAALIQVEAALGENLWYLTDALDLRLRQGNQEAIDKLQQLEAAWKAAVFAIAKAKGDD